MNSFSHIRFLQRHEIDDSKWNQLIEDSPNGLIYAKTFYLDHMAKHWDALILGDYEVIMPLTWNKKFGFYYLFQPPFTRMLGVFQKDSQPFPVMEFLSAVPAKFRYWDIDLNETNTLSSQPIGMIKEILRKNHFLNLNKKHTELSLHYNRLAKRMQRNALNNQFEIVRNVFPEEIISLYEKYYGGNHPNITWTNYQQLSLCMNIAFKNGQAITYLAKWPNGETAAFYLLLIDKNYVYSLMGGSTMSGKKAGAFYLLTDTVIKDHAESNRILRFEGSDIPGIALFNASFGSTLIRYPHIKMNNLPFPIKYLK